MQAWRIRYLDSLTYLFHKIPFDPANQTVTSFADPAYTRLLVGGGIVAVLSLVFLLFMAWKRGNPVEIAPSDNGLKPS